MHPTTAHWHFQIPLIMSQLMVKEYISGDVDKMTHSHHKKQINYNCTLSHACFFFYRVIVLEMCDKKKTKPMWAAFD